MDQNIIDAFLLQIDQGSKRYINVPYFQKYEAEAAAQQRAERAAFVFGHEGAYIEVDLKKKNEPNNLLKEVL